MSNIFQRQQFYPSPLGIFVNPFYIMRRELLRAVRSLASHITGRVLDIGCGSKPYQELFTSSTEYVGMDFDSLEKRVRTKADVFYDGTHFPFPDGSFDAAISTEVLEHIFNPSQFLSETHRVLKPGGKLLLTCPFVWDEHEQPYDYARYSSFGLRNLLEQQGFTIIEQRKTGNAVLALIQLKICYINRVIRVRNHRIKSLIHLVLISPITLVGLFWAAILPVNTDLYLGNVILAAKT